MKIKYQALALTGTAILAMSLGATSAQAAEVQARATARVVQAIVLTKQSDLNFGTIVPFTAARDVSVSNGGTATCGADLVCVANTAAAARFTVRGTTGTTVSVTYPATVSLTGPGAAMSATLNQQPGNITLANGDNLFSFGGTLTVGANQLEGQYSTADFNVVVNYN